jgi:hypothetical protein
VQQQNWDSLKARFGLDLPLSENIFESAFDLWGRRPPGVYFGFRALKV